MARKIIDCRFRLMRLLLFVAISLAAGSLSMGMAKEVTSRSASQDWVEVAETVETEALAVPPEYPNEMAEWLETAERLVNPEGPPLAVSRKPVAGPVPGTETVPPGTQSPLASEDFIRFRKTNVTPILPASYRSNTSEVSVDGAGGRIFMTGNWWAARSTDGGYSFTYIDPFVGLPDFCCDQIVMYDKARNLLLWLRMTYTGAENIYRIQASRDNGTTWTVYDFPSPAGLWYDYPHWALTNDYVYLATNLFTTASSTWDSTRVLKLPLDALWAGIGFGYSYFTDSTYFNATPVQGAYDTMYWGTHVDTSTLRIYSWQEDSGTINWNDVAVDTWTSTPRGSADCGNADNWGGRTDHRILAGWLAKGVIGFMWNVQQGGGFPYPYIEAATFNESDKTHIGRPAVWNSSACFLYPSTAVNARGDVGMVLNYGDVPQVYAAIDDDYNGVPAPWETRLMATGNRRPQDDSWGDYNTCRPMHPASVAWQGGAHTMWEAADNNAYIYYFVFGRERDKKSWARWKTK